MKDLQEKQHAEKRTKQGQKDILCSCHTHCYCHYLPSCSSHRSVHSAVWFKRKQYL